MRALPGLGMLLIGVFVSACSGSETISHPGAVESFSVRLGDEELKAWDAIVDFAFYRDGEQAATLSFRVGEEPARTSLSLWPSFEQFRQRAFTIDLIEGPPAEGEGSWWVDGERMTGGVVSATIAPRGVVFGNTQGTALELSFSGNYVLGCSVPPGSLGKREDAVPVPVPWDGDPRSLSLMWDQDFASAECGEVRRVLEWR
jgi:hypothetical protein